jgi:two-component system cell cycle response regulator
MVTDLQVKTMKKILIVDDDPVSSYIMADLLQEYQTVVVDSINHMYRHIKNDFLPDLILLDVMLPEINGFDAARTLRNEFEMQNIPIIFVSAKTEGSSVRKGFESGGNDYIKKPIDNDELFARVNSVLIQTERERKLLEEASTDPLTGLNNRRYFFESANTKISYCIRKNVNLSIALLDLDHFKNINDQYSHMCGDTVLIKYSEILRAETRDYDVIGRYGGEEFVIAFMDCNREAASQILARVQKTLAQTALKCSGNSIYITFSAGVTDLHECHTNPTSPVHLTDLIKVADERLYAAKESGRDRIIHT